MVSKQLKLTKELDLEYKERLKVLQKLLPNVGSSRIGRFIVPIGRTSHLTGKKITKGNVCICINGMNMTPEEFMIYVYCNFGDEYVSDKVKDVVFSKLI